MDFEFNWLIDSSVLLRLIMAVLLGGIIGMEREMHGRLPGFVRTLWSVWEPQC